MNKLLYYRSINSKRQFLGCAATAFSERYMKGITGNGNQYSGEGAQAIYLYTARETEEAAS